MMGSVFKEFNNILGTINSAYHEAARKMNLSDSELDMLYVFDHYNGSCNQSALYKESGQTKSTINSAVKKMEKEGYLTLSAGTGRNTCVTLTEAGQELMNRTVRRVIQFESDVYDSWSPEDQETFIRLNRDFAEKFTEKVKTL